MIRRAIVAVAALLLAGCVYVARAQTSSKARIKAFAKLPDWSGLWQFDIWTDELDGQQIGPEGLRKAKAYAAAMEATFTSTWQPKIDQLKKAADTARAANPNNPPAYAGYGGCGWVPGFPATMLPGTYEWRVTPEETTLISLLGSVRHIYTDGRPHPPKDELWPMSQGDSIGHWEGTTLVVDTVAIRTPIYLPTLARREEVPFVPMSNELHSIERIRMVNQNQMQIQFTLEDPIALAAPVNVTLTWERVKDINRMEQNADDCDDPATDRNPIVNGRFETVAKPAPTTPTESTGR
jgi:hypothetical protein